MSVVVEREQFQKRLEKQETEKKSLDKLICGLVVNKFEQELKRTTNSECKMSQGDERDVREDGGKLKGETVTLASPHRARRSLGSPAELLTRTTATISFEDKLKSSKGGGNYCSDPRRKERRSSLLNDRRNLWVSTSEKCSMTDPVGE